MMRRVKKVEIHPYYRGKVGKTAKDMPFFDFALIEVDQNMYPWHKTMKPICLPKFKDMWRPNGYQEFFVGLKTFVTGFGRVKSDIIEGKNQTACQALGAYIDIIHHNDDKCSIVSF